VTKERGRDDCKGRRADPFGNSGQLRPRKERGKGKREEGVAR